MFLLTLWPRLMNAACTPMSSSNISGCLDKEYSIMENTESGIGAIALAMVAKKPPYVCSHLRPRRA